MLLQEFFLASCPTASRRPCCIPAATAELQSSLAQFAAFARSLKGDEKSEAQFFLDHFFRALGHGGVQEAGATLEFRIVRREDRPGRSVSSSNYYLLGDLFRQMASPKKARGGRFAVRRFFKKRLAVRRLRLDIHSTVPDDMWNQ